MSPSPARILYPCPWADLHDPAHPDRFLVAAASFGDLQAPQRPRVRGKARDIAGLHARAGKATAPACPPHVDLGLLDRSGRTLIRRTDAQTAATGRPCLHKATRSRHPRLHRQAQPRPQTLQINQIRRRHLCCRQAFLPPCRLYLCRKLRFQVTSPLPCRVSAGDREARRSDGPPPLGKNGKRACRGLCANPWPFSSCQVHASMLLLGAGECFRT